MAEISGLTFESPLPKASAVGKRPDWLKVRLPTSKAYQDLKTLITNLNLHTVCGSAACPNRGECWARSTATFMILGNICTRSCGFCNVATGRPTELDLAEPERVAQAISKLQLNYAVITSVNRDELEDGGAAVWADTIKAIRLKSKDTTIEVLIPDFCGNWRALEQVLAARPNVINHNVETVPSLYRLVRPQGNFERSLELLRRAKEAALPTKSGLMLGLGETEAEVHEVMQRLRSVDCDMLTLGQYMQPTANHLPVVQWVHPKIFKQLHDHGMTLGFKNVFAGPLVRSSYHAQEQSGRLIGR